MNIRHKPASYSQFPGTLTLCTNSAHQYQNKGFLNQNRYFLSPLFSHSCALLRPYRFSFHILHKNTQGEGVSPSPTLRSRIGTGWRGQEGGEIPPLRGPTHHNSARGRKSGRSGPFDSAQDRRDDSGGGGMTEGEIGGTGSAEPLPDAARNWNFAAGPRTVGMHCLSRREGFHATFWQVSYV